jgi:hypothetical protein
MSGGALREILASFGFEIDHKELEKGEKHVHSFTAILGELGETVAAAFAVEKIVEFTHELLEEADALAKQSIALSVSASQLQGWQFAAKLSGSSAEEFNSAFTKFNKNVAEAGKGAGPAADALKALGITTDQLKNKAPIELLDGVADGLVAMQDPAKRTQTIMALFGKSGARLLPLFLEGAEGTKKLREEVEQLGATFDEDFLDGAQEVNDNVDRLKLGFKGLAIQAIKPLLPQIVALTEEGVKVAKWLVDVLKHSNALKAGLIVFSTVATAKAISGMVSLAQKAGFLKNGLRGLLFEMLPLIAAFLVIEDVWTFLTGGKSVTGDALDKFFGAGAAAKVKAFVDTLAGDVGPILHDIMAIFTDGQPLDVKFRELEDYITGTLSPKFKAEFGAMGASMVTLITTAASLAETLTDIVKAMTWIASHTVGAVGKAVFAVSDATANEDAREAARKKKGNEGFFDKARDFLNYDYVPKGDATSGASSAARPISAPAALSAAELKAMISDSFAAAPNVATAPAFGPGAPPAPQVTNQTSIVQHIDASVPEDVRKAAQDGAKAGATEGNNLRTKRALVPTG